MPGVYASVPKEEYGHENQHSYLHISILAVVRLVDCGYDARIATDETRLTGLTNYR